MTATLIAIAGPSASGKSTLARALAERLGPPSTVILPLDAYYRDLSNLPPAERAAWNFDAPEAFDWSLMREHLDALTAGRAVDMPEYDFRTHTRRHTGNRVAPGAYLILEGLYALYREDIRGLCALKVFLSADPETCLARRLARDAQSRGRTRESVTRQWRATVEPMYHAHVEPRARYADLVLPGDAPVDELVAAVIARLPAR